MNESFLSDVTIKPKYPRPAFVLPDLHGPLGNSVALCVEVARFLSKQGFVEEAKMLAGRDVRHADVGCALGPSRLLQQTAYKDLPNMLSRFVILENQASEVVTEDEQYTYVKIKKHAEIQNCKEFKSLSETNQEGLSKLLKENPDWWGLRNTYKRPFWVYLYQSSCMDWVMDQPEYLDTLDELDVFGQCDLNRLPSLKLWSKCLEKHLKYDQTFVSGLLVTQDVFGRSPVMHLGELIAQSASQINTLAHPSIQEIERVLAQTMLALSEENPDVLESMVSKEMSQYLNRQAKKIIWDKDDLRTRVEYLMLYEMKQIHGSHKASSTPKIRL